MNTSFTEVMSKKTNRGLVQIVTIDKDKYQPLAIEAAKNELSKRNIDPHRFNNIQEEINTETEKIKDINNLTVSSTTRFVNFLIDFFSSFLFIGIIVTIIGNGINIAKMPRLFSSLIFILSYVGYYIYFESVHQKTIGKFITNTKVVTKEGAQPSLNEIISRSFCRLIPFDRISFLLTKNGFHDAISNTKVIKDQQQE